VLSLALGIGANTAIFSLVNGVLLRSLAVPNPQELRVLTWAGGARTMNYSGSTAKLPEGRASGGSFPYTAYCAFRDRGPGLAATVAFAPLDNVTLLTAGESFTTGGMIVSGNFFEGLGVSALIGRALAREDDQPGAEPVAMLTHACWQRNFGGHPGIVGQAVTLGGARFTVVGVLPRAFTSPEAGVPVDFYVPLSAQPQLRPRFSLDSPGNWWLSILARLTPDADERQTQAALAVIFRQELVNTTLLAEPSLTLEDGRGGPLPYRQRYRQLLGLLMGVSGMVLLIACANVAGLLLARGAARRHEFSVRAALGARWGQLLRPAFAESLVLASAGAGLGLVLAVWGQPLLLHLLRGIDETAVFDVRIDTTVLAFALVATLGTALLAGLAPAWRATQSSPAAGLQARALLAAPRLRFGKVLVAVQVGLTLLLLVGAGLFIRTLHNLWRTDAGFASEHLLVFRLNAPQAGYRGQALIDFYERTRETLAALPGVQAVAVTDTLLLSGSVNSSQATVPGHAASGDRPVFPLRMRMSDSFLSTMGIPLLRGRDLAPGDGATAPKVAVVNEAFARLFFVDENPIGQTLVMSGAPRQIVGVCRDIKYRNLKTPAEPAVYLPYRQEPGSVGAMNFEIRTALPPLGVLPAIRQAVATLDRNVPLARIQTQSQLLDGSIAQERLLAAVCGGLAGFAVLLSGIGLFGLLGYQVTRRTGEIGIRMALGAAPQRVIRSILREALLLAAAGIAIGLPAALALAQIVESRLYGVAPADPLTLAAGVLVLLAIAALAAWLPARRAAKVDPMIALRAE
jgi:predicted permease